MNEAKEKSGLALVKPEAQTASLALTGAVRINGFADVFALAKTLANARGFVPSQFLGQPDSLAAVILTGIELGLGPMEAMRSLHVIEGRPTMSAEAMLARARRAGVRTRWAETTAERATIEVTVPGEKPQTMSFTMAEAKAAGLAGKGNWSKHPAAMLRARATSAAIRAFCPEVLGAGVYESESGEITDGVPSDVIEATIVPEAKPAAHPWKGRSIKEVKTPDDLRGWCEAYGEWMKKQGESADAVKAYDRAVKAGAAMTPGPVPELVVRQWLSLPIEAPSDGPPREVEDGSLSADPP